MIKKTLVKQHTRKNGQIVKTYKRQKQYSTFNKGYNKSVRDIYNEFEKINLEEKDHYWRWQLFWSFIKEKRGKINE